jgi:hypothetical protein
MAPVGMRNGSGGISTLTEEEEDVCMLFMDKISSNNKTLNARLLARVITGCHYT